MFTDKQMASRGSSLPHALVRFAIACVAAISAAGCSMNSSVFDADSYNGALSKPLKVFDAPDWATGRSSTNIQLGPSGPVAAEDMVTADGNCAPEANPAAPTAAAPPPPEPAAPPA